MKFDNWDYSRQGEFDRTDTLLRNEIVATIDEPLAPVEPRVGVPTQFRTKKGHREFEVQSECDNSYGSAMVFRTPDDSTPDVVLNSIEGENLIQRLPDGGIARWISWPPPWQAKDIWTRETWYGLWRIEYPDGRIERFLPELYSNPNQTYASYLAKENGKNGVSEIQPDGSVLLKDGGGRTYAKLVGDKFYPYALAIGTEKGLLKGWSMGMGGRFRYMNWAKGEYEWSPQSGTFNSPDRARLESLLRISKQAILAMRPSDVVKLYYSTGQWEQYLDDRQYRVKYKGGLIPLYGESVFLIETMIRQRLYAFRPDLHTVKLSDGSVVPGLINWAIFPPLDGYTCYAKESGLSKLLKVFDVIGSVVTSLIPGVGQLAALGITYANAKEKQRVLADQMKLMESGAKFLELAQGAQAGAMEIIAKDPPSRADIEQQARAAGEPVPTATAAGGGIGILLAGVAAFLALS